MFEKAITGGLGLTVHIAEVRVTVYGVQEIERSYAGALRWRYSRYRRSVGRQALQTWSRHLFNASGAGLYQIKNYTH